MKPSLQLKLSQHLALTPQLQQSIRLLQLSTLELEQELEKFLAENPLLERQEDEYAAIPSSTERENGEVAAETPSPEPVESNRTEEDSWLGDEGGSYAVASGSFDEDDNDFQDIQAATTSLRDHLLWQLGLIKISERDRTLVA